MPISGCAEIALSHANTAVNQAFDILQVVMQAADPNPTAQELEMLNTEYQKIPAATLAFLGANKRLEEVKRTESTGQTRAKCPTRNRLLVRLLKVDV